LKKDLSHHYDAEYADWSEEPYGNPGSAIIIEGRKSFREEVTTALDRLKSTPTGAGLLSMITQYNLGNSVRIRFSRSSGQCHYVGSGIIPGFVVEESDVRKALQAGRGTSSVVLTDGDGREFFLQRGTKDPRALARLLAHELLHALHAMWSQVSPRRFENPDLAPTHEEARTVGLGPYADEWLTENRIRLELGLPPRTKY